MLRKMWQEPRNTKCETAVNWVTKTVRTTIWNRALGLWETKVANCEVIPIVKLLIERGGPKAPFILNNPLGPIFYPIDKSTITSDYLENYFTPKRLA
jgi:hypothetical protein